MWHEKWVKLLGETFCLMASNLFTAAYGGVGLVRADGLFLGRRSSLLINYSSLRLNSYSSQSTLSL